MERSANSKKKKEKKKKREKGRSGKWKRRQRWRGSGSREDYGKRTAAETRCGRSKCAGVWGERHRTGQGAIERKREEREGRRC